MRLPRKLFAMLCQHAEPQMFGLTYAGGIDQSSYDGGIHLSVVDPHRFQQTLWSLQESVTSGDVDHVSLLWHLTRGR